MAETQTQPDMHAMLKRYALLRLQNKVAVMDKDCMAEAAILLGQMTRQLPENMSVIETKGGIEFACIKPTTDSNSLYDFRAGSASYVALDPIYESDQQARALYGSHIEKRADDFATRALAKLETVREKANRFSEDRSIPASNARGCGGGVGR
jgi:hypothetical protein